MKARLLVAVLVPVFTLVAAIGTFSENETYCFQFTWVGPNFDSESFVLANDTCKSLHYNVCTTPLIYSNDTTPPNTTIMWNNYKKYKLNVVCPLREGSVCAKYNLYFEDSLQYSTSLCTKITVPGEEAMKDGCVSNETNSIRTELCACQSYRGKKPCNDASRVLTVQIFVLMLCTWLVVINSFRDLSLT